MQGTSRTQTTIPDGQAETIEQGLLAAERRQAEHPPDALEQLRGRLWPMLRHPVSQSEGLLKRLQEQYATVLDALELKEPPPSPPSSALRSRQGYQGKQDQKVRG